MVFENVCSSLGFEPDTFGVESNLFANSATSPYTFKKIFAGIWLFLKVLGLSNFLSFVIGSLVTYRQNLIKDIDRFRCNKLADVTQLKNISFFDLRKIF